MNQIILRLKSVERGKKNYSDTHGKNLRNEKLESAKKIRQAVNIPVIMVGGIQKLSDIRDITENDQCDFVSMARPFIIEPDLVNKFSAGKQQESRCINCNFCAVGIDARPFKCYFGKINQKKG